MSNCDYFYSQNMGKTAACKGLHGIHNYSLLITNL